MAGWNNGRLAGWQDGRMAEWNGPSRPPYRMVEWRIDGMAEGPNGMQI